jgi:hypothetical protein
MPDRQAAPAAGERKVPNPPDLVLDLDRRLHAAGHVQQRFWPTRQGIVTFGGASRVAWCRGCGRGAYVNDRGDVLAGSLTDLGACDAKHAVADQLGASGR